MSSDIVLNFYESLLREDDLETLEEAGVSTPYEAKPLIEYSSYRSSSITVTKIGGYGISWYGFRPTGMQVKRLGIYSD
ncbi:putative SUMO/sentrin specific peptidase family member 8 [Schistosoma japonicum]|uniref:Putative SUMO/sentrin specific peptidase family member 8 n=1 Tax=Schistosoma japonicum TaxID=6182 RepID=A0A4Z2D778_SCHJA|nr:putative SUMO/sentrin specific peptidase family member 8 [Schistosoma japonicum]